MTGPGELTPGGSPPGPACPACSGRATQAGQEIDGPVWWTCERCGETFPEPDPEPTPDDCPQGQAVAGAAAWLTAVQSGPGQFLTVHGLTIERGPGDDPDTVRIVGYVTDRTGRRVSVQLLPIGE